MEHPESLRTTAFGEVLAELLEKREIPVTPFQVGKLAEEAGLDGWAVINRMANPDAENFGHLAPHRPRRRTPVDGTGEGEACPRLHLPAS